MIPELRNRPNRLNHHILGPLVLVISLLIIVFMVMEFDQENEAIDSKLQERSLNVQQLLTLGENNNIDFMHGLLRFIVDDESYKTAFLQGDRKALLDLTTPVFNRIREKHHITHFYFLNPQREVFLRVHQPHRYGDKIERITARESEQTSRPASGLEVGPLGTLTLRMVMPWRQKGQLIGYIELGVELSEVMKMIRQYVSSNILISLHKTLLNRSLWEDWQKQHNRHSQWDLLKRDVIVDGAFEYFPGVIKTINDKTLRDVPGNRNVVVNNGEQRLRLSFVPLNNARQQQVGDMIIILDVTKERTRLWNSMLSFVVIGLIAGGGVFILFFVILKKVRKTLDDDEEVMRSSLEEKGILLQEIHHRVKNNLQVVSSMLALQASTETNEHATAALQEGERRIKVMARVHDNLCRSDDMSQISAKNYLEIIISDIQQTSMHGNNQVIYESDIDDIVLDVDQAIPMGQIVSELLSNTQKHAFPNGDTGTVTLSLKHFEDKSITLTVADDGIGMPENIDIHKSNSLGLQLVSALTKKLNGEIEIENQNGTCVHILIREGLL